MNTRSTEKKKALVLAKFSKQIIILMCPRYVDLTLNDDPRMCVWGGGGLLLSPEY